MDHQEGSFFFFEIFLTLFFFVEFIVKINYTRKKKREKGTNQNFLPNLPNHQPKTAREKTPPAKLHAFYGISLSLRSG